MHRNSDEWIRLANATAFGVLAELVIRKVIQTVVRQELERRGAC